MPMNDGLPAATVDRSAVGITTTTPVIVTTLIISISGVGKVRLMFLDGELLASSLGVPELLALGALHLAPCCLSALWSSCNHIS